MAKKPFCENVNSCPADCSEDGGSGGTGGDQDLPLVITIDDGPWDKFVSDGGGDYIHGEGHVRAFASDRIKLFFPGGGKKRRKVTVTVTCEAIPASAEFGAAGIDNCGVLEDNFGIPFTFTVGYISSVVPYMVNCPTQIEGECPDVFTMGQSTQLMSFWLLSGIAPTIEAASEIGGPGACLSLLTTAQRNAFIANNCHDDLDDPANCNVTITALHSGPDGENDVWRIDTNLDEYGNPIGIKALICSSGNQSLEAGVIGQTTLTFGFDAEVKQ